MEDELDELGVLGKEIDGRYRLERFIGAGTMGAVYEGKQIAVGRRVAIKLLNAALQTHQEVRDRFRVEAQAIATLSHPNCVTLYDFGFAEELGSLYMAVEYLDGEPLDFLIADGLEPRTALLLAKQVADVFAVAHEADIIHRDLKPENVMVVRGSDGLPQAKVLDFGLARIFEDASGGARLTRQGQLFGTPAYMSPEQCKSAMDVGPPADIYALGVSLFEMLMGRLPFESPSVPELLVLHSTKTAPPVVTSDEIPLEVCEMVARMMAKNAEDRPTARQISEVLGAVLEGNPPPPLPEPVSMSGEREVVATRATLALMQDKEDATTTGMVFEQRAGTPTLAIGALALSAVILLAAVAITMSGDESAEAQQQPVVDTPAAVEKPVVETPPVEPAEDIAPDLAEDKAAFIGGERVGIAKSMAATFSESERAPTKREQRLGKRAGRAELAKKADAAKQTLEERRAAAEKKKRERKKRMNELRGLGQDDAYE